MPENKTKTKTKTKKADSDSCCPQCGAKLTIDAKFCPSCGYNLDPEVVILQPSTNKSRLVAGLLAIFLGSLGIHNFYLGYTNKALVQLCVTIIGGPFTCGLAPVAMGIWGLVEGVMILSNSPGYDRDAQGNPLRA